MTDQLKACPFCGKPAFGVIHEEEITKIYCVNIRCPANTTLRMTLEKWNYRPLEDALQAEVDTLNTNLREACEEMQKREFDNFALAHAETILREGDNV